MKTTLALTCLLTLTAFAYERLQGPTELLLHDKEKAFAGYTLFGVGSRTYLLDMEARVVHTWPVGTNPKLLDNGNIVDASKDDPSGFQRFKEVDWDGKTVWEYTEKREGYAPHHDWTCIFNKQLNAPTTLYIANKSITNEQALAAGADPRNSPYRDGEMDAIVEVDMQGKIVWEWCFFDQVVQDVDPAKPNHVGAGKTVADHPGRININLPGRPLRRDWLHCNSMDYNAESGHIVINSVLEINPFLDASGKDTGKYVNPPAAGYRRESYDKDTHNQPRQISNQIVRSCRSVNSHGFFSHIGSSGQALPNGNMFICSDTEGHFFEVTAKGELAWEYINPVTREGAVKVLGDVLPMTNSAFRAYRYAPDHPAFKGRDLTPKGTITERAAKGLDVQPKRRPPGDRPPGKGEGQGGGDRQAQ